MGSSVTGFFFGMFFPSPRVVLRCGPGLTPLRLETIEEAPPSPSKPPRDGSAYPNLTPTPIPHPKPWVGSAQRPGPHPIQAGCHREVVPSQRAGAFF